MKLLLFLCILFLSTYAVIFGTDSRVNPFEITDGGGQRSVLGVQTKSRFTEDSGTYTATTDELSFFTYDACSGVRFADEGVLPFCTATLVDIDGTDFVLTSSGCVKDIACDDLLFFFSYRNTAGNTILAGDSVSFPPEKVVECGTLYDLGDVLDAALIEPLNPVDSSIPRFSLQQQAPSIGTDLTFYGTPSGLPIKVAAEGEVQIYLPNTRGFTFPANVDAFRGSEGGPAVLRDTKEIVGIFSVGLLDYAPNTDDGCFDVVQCEDDGCYRILPFFVRADAIYNAYNNIVVNDCQSSELTIEEATIKGRRNNKLVLKVSQDPQEDRFLWAAAENGSTTKVPYRKSPNLYKKTIRFDPDETSYFIIYSPEDLDCVYVNID